MDEVPVGIMEKLNGWTIERLKSNDPAQQYAVYSDDPSFVMNVFQHRAHAEKYFTFVAKSEQKNG